MANSGQKIALVTGGNRGLGYGTCQSLIGLGYEVILTSRDVAKGESSAKRLNAKYIPLDITSPESMDKVFEQVSREYGRLDVLVNNAGVFLDRGTALEAKLDVLQATLTTNTFGPFLMCQRFIPLMQKSGSGRVVNVSSGMGQLSEMRGGYAAYRISKTALNAVTKIFASETWNTGILVNAVCPGWVKTDMGGAGADRSLEEGVSGIVWAATLPKGGPSGGYFRDGKAIPW